MLYLALLKTKNCSAPGTNTKPKLFFHRFLPYIFSSVFSSVEKRNLLLLATFHCAALFSVFPRLPVLFCFLLSACCTHSVRGSETTKKCRKRAVLFLTGVPLLFLVAIIFIFFVPSLLSLLHPQNRKYCFPFRTALPTALQHYLLL